MDIQSIKLKFIEDFLRLQNEQLILKLNGFLNREKKKIYENSLKPMTINELHKKIKQYLHMTYNNIKFVRKS